MEDRQAAPPRRFDHLREHSVGLPEVLFQSITHMAPAAAVAFSILVAVQFAGPALPLAVLFALIACTLVANSIGQLAKQMPSAGGLYTYVSRALGKRAGFMTGWAFLLFEPMVAPLLFLIFAWATEDVVKNDLDANIGWWPWVLVAGAIVFVLTYRDVRLSTRAGVLLGLFEIAVFAALAVWILISKADSLGLGAFDPTNAEAGTFNGIFKGMVFTVLAFIGFEAAAPLGEEARHPRWTIPRAVVLSAVGIGLFYVLCSYAWVYGAGFDNFVTQSGETANPWRALATVFWGSGWVLVFFAIVNSALANANAGVNAGTRVIYAMARNGVLPAIFARTHPRFRTPHVAIVLNVFGGLIVALLLGWKWDPITAFTIIAVTITIVVIVIYMAVCLGSIVYYWTQKREEFSIWLHGVFPVRGAVAFAFPLYYQYNPLPDYPIRYANWAAIGWLVLGVLVLVWLERTRPEALENADRIYVEAETLAPATGAAPAPAAR
jgi:amino acid transporter